MLLGGVACVPVVLLLDWSGGCVVLVDGGVAVVLPVLDGFAEVPLVEPDLVQLSEIDCTFCTSITGWLLAAEVCVDWLVWPVTETSCPTLPLSIESLPCRLNSWPLSAVRV